MNADKEAEARTKECRVMPILRIGYPRGVGSPEYGFNIEIPRCSASGCGLWDPDRECCGLRQRIPLSSFGGGPDR